MKTYIKFEVLKDGKHLYETVAIEHTFEEIPPSEFLGHQLPRQSIESQVIDYLDSIDKSQMMIEHSWDIIFDYEPDKQIDEVQELFDYLEPYVSQYPQLYKPIESIIYECKDILFGKGKDVGTKAHEVICILGITHKAFSSTIDMLLKLVDSDYKLKLKLQ